MEFASTLALWLSASSLTVAEVLLGPANSPTAPSRDVAQEARAGGYRRAAALGAESTEFTVAEPADARPARRERLAGAGPRRDDVTP